MAQFEVPFIYLAKVVPPKGYKPRDVCVSSCINVEVAETCEEDLPLALTVRTPEGKETDVYSHAGKFYAVRVEGNGEPNLTGIQDLAQRLINGTCDGIGNLYQHMSYTGKVIEEEALTGHVQSSGRAAAIAGLEDALSKLIICGDRVLERKLEPCWQATEQSYIVGGFRTEYRVSSYDAVRNAAMVEAGYNGNNPGEFWRADMEDVMRAYLDMSINTRAGSIVVHRPDLLALSVEDDAVLYAARRAVNTLGDCLSRASKPAMMRYADLRDALNDCTDTLSLDAEDAVRAVVMYREPFLDVDIDRIEMAMNRRELAPAYASAPVALPTP